ncbi:MAG: hypothetical protein JSS91_12425 [Bacteroidetes bacterium]|nr:hypothetical protein [Bacteroidota bacterium]
MKKLPAVNLLITALFAFTIYSCVNIEQQTVINEDGSGSIDLHYWTKTANLSMGDELGGFSFTEDKIRKNFTSLNSDVGEVKIEESKSDSLTHVRLKIVFRDFNKLPEAQGFSKTKTLWKKEKDKIIFRYTLLKDTVSSDKLASAEYKLFYTFTFPDEILETNGTKEVNTVTWNKTLADLKNDIDMTAEIKNNSGICGIFGIELPILFLFSVIISKIKKYKFKKK